MQKRIEALKNDLKMDILACNPTDGSIIIVSPRRDDLELNMTYMNWLVEVLTKMVSPKVRIIVLPNNQLKIEHKKESETHVNS